MTIQTQAFTPPEFQPLKICTYKPTSKAKNKYFKLILNSATHIVRNKFKILSNNILPSILPCQKIHLT